MKKSKSRREVRLAGGWMAVEEKKVREKMADIYK